MAWKVERCGHRHKEEMTIGNGAVIGAGAVVIQSVPDYAIVAGVSVRVIKFHFDEETRSRLVSLNWWDWDNNKIIRARNRV